MIKIEASSFFSPDEWKLVEFEMFKKLAAPDNEAELADLLKALESGELVLSIVGTMKFRKAKTGPDPDCPNCDGTGGALPDGACGICWNWRGDEIWEHHAKARGAK